MLLAQLAQASPEYLFFHCPVGVIACEPANRGHRVPEGKHLDSTRPFDAPAKHQRAPIPGEPSLALG
jgi:hypothetical protein